MSNRDPLVPLLLAVCVALGGMLAQSHGLPQGCDLPTLVSTAPIKAPGFRILIVEESSQRHTLPASQVAIFTSAAITEYANAKCAKIEGVPEFRVYDPDVPLTSESETWKEAMAVARTSLPWLICSDGKRGYSGPLPKTVDETLAILKRYGG